MATVMAEMYDMGDKDHNEKLEKREFIRVMQISYWYCTLYSTTQMYNRVELNSTFSTFKKGTMLLKNRRILQRKGSAHSRLSFK